MSIRETGCPISKPISLKEFHDDFKQENVLECSYYSTYTNSVGTDVSLLAKNDVANQIADNCSLIHLNCESDKFLWDEIKIVPPRQRSQLKQFKTFEYFQKGLSEYRHIPTFMRNTNRQTGIAKDMSYNNSRDVDSEKIADLSTDKLSLILDDIVVTVMIFKPLKDVEFSHLTRNLIRTLTPEMRVDLLGSQTMKNLWDIVNCKNSESLMGDFSEIMHDWVNHKVHAKDGYKGGFFFIENTFFDLDEGEDLSSPIINWIARCPDRIEQFGVVEKRTMRDVRLDQLTVCIGKPYLLRHLGNCEHFLVFSNVRLVSKHDCQDPSKYPIITGKCTYKIIKCLFCETANSEWLVTNCKITPTEQTPMCEYCLRMFLYDKDFKKIEDAGDFKVFKFPSFL